MIMNNREKEIYDEIVSIYSTNVNRWFYNAYYLTKIAEATWEDLMILAINNCYKILDYIDGRKNLIYIPNYDEDTWEKVNKKNIKAKLLKVDTESIIKEALVEWRDLKKKND